MSWQTKELTAYADFRGREDQIPSQQAFLFRSAEFALEATFEDVDLDEF